MLLKDYKLIFLKALSTVYDEHENESLFYLILMHFHHMKRLDLALNPHTIITKEQLQQWQSVVLELKTHKPVQYILGATEFYGLPFLVNENTLIPRPETEELVDWIVVESRKFPIANLKILDIGTGSGCIAISLAKNLPNAQVSAIDVSEKALAIAKKNAEINQVEVNFRVNNILETDDLEHEYDLIVSNPPYVRNLEKQEIKPNVLHFEPHLALFVADTDALVFYKKIAQLALKNLAVNGQLYFEINQYLGKETVDLLSDMGFKNICLLKDLHQNDRMICCTL